MKTSNIRITSSDIKDGLSLRVRPGSAAPCPSLSLTKSPPEHEGWSGGGVEKNSLSFMSLDTVWINAKTQPIMNWNPVEIEGQSCLFFFRLQCREKQVKWTEITVIFYSSLQLPGRKEEQRRRETAEAAVVSDCRSGNKGSHLWRIQIKTLKLPEFHIFQNGFISPVLMRASKARFNGTFLGSLSYKNLKDQRGKPRVFLKNPMS